MKKKLLVSALAVSLVLPGTALAAEEVKTAPNNLTEPKPVLVLVQNGVDATKLDPVLVSDPAVVAKLTKAELEGQALSVERSKEVGILVTAKGPQEDKAPAKAEPKKEVKAPATKAPVKKALPKTSAVK